MCQQKILKTGYFRQLARKSDGNFGKKRGSDSSFCLQRNANSELFWAEKQPSASSWAWKRTIILAKWFSNLGSVLRGLIVLARGYTKTIFALPNTCWEIQKLELHRHDAGYVMASKNYFSKAAASEFFIFHFCILFSTRWSLHLTVIAVPYSSAPDSCPHGRMSQGHLTILQRASWRSQSWTSRLGASSGFPSFLWFLQ